MKHGLRSLTLAFLAAGFACESEGQELGIRSQQAVTAPESRLPTPESHASLVAEAAWRMAA
jgi:hypothetical protein